MLSPKCPNALEGKRGGIGGFFGPQSWRERERELVPLLSFHISGTRLKVSWCVCEAERKNTQGGKIWDCSKEGE